MSGISKRVSGSWVSGDYGIMGTSTDTLTTLPAVLYPNAATATVGLKGNTVQNGTPTPDNPIMPQGTGDLETVGEKAGQYKIPISSASTTTPVYLGEVETTRKIRKLVLTGEEEWASYTSIADCYRLSIANAQGVTRQGICSHYAIVNITSQLVDGTFVSGQNYSYFKDVTAQNLDGWKSYLAAQYAAGTPVTVWYVLANETTGIVNEPLMKIGDYADTVSGITIPTIAGANALSVDTTVQPSEVTVNYKGWHPVADVHERENGAWT